MRKLLLAMGASALLAAPFAAPAEANHEGPTFGAVAGATTGAIIGGPPGAIIGGIAGAGIGAAAAHPPAHVRTFVMAHPAPAVRMRTPVVIGTALPPAVTLRPIPQYRYHFAVVNGRNVLVDPHTRVVVHVM
jgi:hypothetical protein